MDANPSHHELDIGAVTAYNRFWQDVEMASASSNMEYDLLVLDWPQYEGIEPHSAPSHNAEKLRLLWRTSIGNYTTALTNSRPSGTHTSDLFTSAEENLMQCTCMTGSGSDQQCLLRWNESYRSAQESTSWRTMKLLPLPPRRTVTCSHLPRSASKVWTASLVFWKESKEQIRRVLI